MGLLLRTDCVDASPVLRVGPMRASYDDGLSIFSRIVLIIISCIPNSNFSQCGINGKTDDEG